MLSYIHIEQITPKQNVVFFGLFYNQLIVNVL